MQSLLEDSFSAHSHHETMERWLQETAPTAAPTAEDDGDTKTEVFSKVMSNILLFFLIFGLSATVNMKDLKHQLRNKFAIGCGVAMQFIIMPFLGFLAVIATRNAGLTEAMGIALLVVTASPGGSYSNWWCSTFNADLALSVAMTTVSSILSIGLLPANLLLYTYLAYGVTDDGEESVIEALDFGALFLTLGVVMGAIAFGLYAGYVWDYPWFHVSANRLGSVCGLLLIVFSLFLSSGADGAESNFWSQPWAFYVGVAFPCLVGIALANIISRSVRLSPPETVAISIECCYQNTGIATSVAITMFSDKEERAQAVSVPLFYGLVEALVIGLYCVWAWKMGWTKAPKDEKFCVVISKTYEVEGEEARDEQENNDEATGDDGKSSEWFGEEPELDPEALGQFPQSELETGEEEKQGTIGAAPKQKKPETVGTGFWARVFPPILRRMTSSFFSGATSLEEPVDEENPDASKTPAKGKDDDQRGRFASADYTAETSMCSGNSPFPVPRTPDFAMCGAQAADADDVPFSPLAQPLAPPLSIPESADPTFTPTSESSDN